MAKRVQHNLFMPESDWRPPDMNELPDWKGASRVCIDVETYDPNLKETGPSIRTGGHLAGIGFALEGHARGFYLPISHVGGDNLDRDQVMAYIKHQCKLYEGEIVGANLSYDLDWLWEVGIEMPRAARYSDVLIAEPLINENKWSYSLDSVSTEWLGEKKEKTLMLEAALAMGMKKKTELGAYIHELPARYVGVYAETDCTLPLRVLKKQLAEIERQKIQRIWNLESDLLPVLVKMRRRGVRVDQDRLAQVEERCNQERKAASDFITRESGVAVGPDDALKKGILVEALRAVDFDIDADASVDKDFITRYEKESPVVEALGRLRKWDTLRKLSIDPVKLHLVKGRIHCSFNQLAKDDGEKGGIKGARYGRLSCEHVNMQQQPARDEDIKPIWRRIYLPDEGAEWAALDYSQQEPRMTVHFAEECMKLKKRDFPMDRAFEAAEAYRNDPDCDNHQMMADMAGIPRNQAKTLFLGLCYGMGQIKLCQSLGLPTKVIQLEWGSRRGEFMEVAGDEGGRIIKRFNKQLPFLKQLEQLCNERAREKGFITTLLGRRCRFTRSKDGLNWWGTQKALNRLIQGSAADQTKLALVEVDRAGFPLQLQVHDEIDLSIENHGQAREIADIMTNCVKLNIPSKVDIDVGPSWGEAEAIAA